MEKVTFLWRIIRVLKFVRDRLILPRTIMLKLSCYGKERKLLQEKFSSVNSLCVLQSILYRINKLSTTCLFLVTNPQLLLVTIILLSLSFQHHDHLFSLSTFATVFPSNALHGWKCLLLHSKNTHPLRDS